MQTQPFQLYAVQFFSRSFSRDDVVMWDARLAVNDGPALHGSLTIKFGSPLLEGSGDLKMRANYAQPWPIQEGPASAAEQWVDPHAEIRWPAYALAYFYPTNQEKALPTLDVSVLCDFLQALRTKVSAELAGVPEIKAICDQFPCNSGYRFSYWTPLLDSAGNPLPVPTGDYISASRGEPIGPGFAALRGTGLTPKGPEYCSLGLVWSQTFSFPPDTKTAVDEAQLQKRIKELKQQFNAKDDLVRAEECLQKGDVRGCITVAQIAVEAAMRFYCNYCGVRLPSLPGIEFHQRIERVLKRAGRASYQSADPAGLCDLQHLYRASLKAHEGDCSYRDDQLHKDVICDQRHARQLLDTAIRFTFWLDSQA